MKQVGSEKAKTNYRIGWGMIFALLVVSGIADIATIIPFVGDLVGPAYWGGMTWYLWKTGHGIVDWKKLVTGGFSIVVELIPFLQWLPTIFVCTAIIIVISHFEDKTGLSLAHPLSEGKKLTLPRQQRRSPANQGGVRLPRKDHEIAQDNIINADFSPPNREEDIAA